MVKAVLFDMDGLLVDSERVAQTAMAESAKLQGYRFTEKLLNHTIGCTKEFSVDFYHRYFPDLDGDRLFNDFRSIMLRYARDGIITLKKGAAELLNALRSKGIPCAVASSSAESVIRLYLEKNGVLDYFACLQSGTEEALPSKPAPDIFLRTAERLGMRPEDCLVLEDSVNGVKAGRAAGMTVCMIPDLIPYTDALAPYCDYVMEDLAAVVRLIV